MEVSAAPFAITTRRQRLRRDAECLTVLARHRRPRGEAVRSDDCPRRLPTVPRCARDIGVPAETLVVEHLRQLDVGHSGGVIEAAIDRAAATIKQQYMDVMLDVTTEGRHVLRRGRRCAVEHSEERRLGGHVLSTVSEQRHDLLRRHVAELRARRDRDDLVALALQELVCWRVARTLPAVDRTWTQRSSVRAGSPRPRTRC